jgi:predicted AAA+ superfamily ATPase
MKRIIDAYLEAWKTDPYRKPILLRGARQIGKTHAIRLLGKTFSEFIEINFEREPATLSIFEADKNLDPKRICEEILAVVRKKIVPGNTLLFFDEIQVVPRAITALRYFYEEMPELHVIAAGSLINFAIDQVGIPIGRVDSLYMYPMSLLEFFAATGNTVIVEQLLEKKDIEYSSGVHAHMLDIVGRYLAVGGMPETVKKWQETGDINQCLNTDQALIDTYRQDFGKYSKKSQIDHVEKVFNSIPYQLGGKFKYSIIEGDYRKRELAPALDLLTTAGVAHKIFHTAGQGIPLGAEIDLDIYKTILMDDAISQKILGLNAGQWILNPMQEFVNKGALVEAFVGQEILAYSDPRQKAQLHYWQRTVKNSAAEIDYVIQDQEKILPIEVKSGHGTTLKSMHMFLDTHHKSPYGVRFSANNYSVHERIHSLPLYAVAQVVLKNKEMILNALL